MKLSELRPCDKCGGKIAPNFYVIRISVALVTPGANYVLGMTQMLGGNLALGEVFSPDAEGAVIVAMDDNPELGTEIILCMDCYLTKEINLAWFAESVNKQKEQAEVEGAHEG